MGLAQSNQQYDVIGFASELQFWNKPLRALALQLLDEIEVLGKRPWMPNLISTPWLLSFSFGRALQQTVLQTAWQGKAGNVEIAQHALLKRARLNSAAQCGEYLAEMEQIIDHSRDHG